MPIEEPGRAITPWDAAVAVALAIGLLVLYFRTLCPGLYWFDSAEMVNCARFLDIPHSPGYPLYLILIRIAGMVPMGTFPARINAVSAVTAALAVPGFYMLARTLAVARPEALVGAGVLAVSETFWDLSGVAEVYGLEMLLLAGTLLAYVGVRRGKTSPGVLGFVGASLVFHRVTNLFCVAGLVMAVRARLQSFGPPGRGLKMLAAGTVLAALPYLLTAYLFFLAGPRGPGMPWSLSWFDFPRTPLTFFRLVTGTIYAGHLGLLSPRDLLVEVAAWLQWAAQQIGIVALALGLLGAIRPPRPMAFLLWVLVPNLLFYAHYNAIERDTMYLPGLAALVILGMGVLSRWPVRLRAGALAIIVLSAAAALPATFRTIDKSAFRGVERADRDVAWWLPRKSHVVLTDDQLIYSLMYCRYAQGVRPDLTLTIVDDFNPAIDAGIRAALHEGHAVYSPLFYPPDRFANVRQRFTLVPEGFLYRLLGAPEPLPPIHGPTLDLGPAGQLVGMDLRGEDASPVAGSLIVLRCSWSGRAAHAGSRAASTARVGMSTGATGAGATPTEATRSGGHDAGGAGTGSIGSASIPDAPMLVLVWPGAVRALAVGTQGRPGRVDSSRGEIVMTEELFARVPDAAAGRPALWVLPSRCAAVRAGWIWAQPTTGGDTGSFFKGISEEFVKCAEDGVPAYGTRWRVRGDAWRAGAAGPIEPGGPR